MSETALIVRTADMIADEINSIKTETFRFLEAANNYATRQTFEVGKRLIEAKKMVDPGKWIDWLRDSVDYSEDTAQNMMRIYREYDSGNPAIQGMSYSQLVALFPLPSAERSEFAEKNEVSSLSVKQIKQLIKDKEAAEKKLQAAEKAAASVDTLKASNSKLKTDYDAAKRQSELDAKTAKRYLQEKQDLEKELKQLKSAPPQVKIEKVPGEVTEEQIAEIRSQLRSEYEKKQEQEQAKQNPVLVEINFYFQQVQNDLNLLFDRIASLPSEDSVKLFRMMEETFTRIIGERKP